MSGSAGTVRTAPAPATEGLEAIFENVFGNMEKFIEVCPDNIWTQKFGGWPVWQHVYHILALTGTFAAGAPPAQLPMPMETVRLAQTPDTSWSRREAKVFAAQMRLSAGSFCAGLGDADLGRKNEFLSQMFKSDMPHSAAFALMIGHLFYHLGVCDSALRENGLKGMI
ncbi:MAG: DinB family protein [Deltaproteobacteria bacterium]|jgi:hypothetical protein|nr:DinB family protein [Deltaproteobacteria bacterium]